MINIEHVYISENTRVPSIGDLRVAGMAFDQVSHSVLRNIPFLDPILVMGFDDPDDIYLQNVRTGAT